MQLKIDYDLFSHCIKLIPSLPVEGRSHDL